MDDMRHDLLPAVLRMLAGDHADEGADPAEVSWIGEVRYVHQVQSAHGAAVRSGGEGGRRARRGARQYHPGRRRFRATRLKERLTNFGPVLNVS
jgi:hypothetical protein